MISAKIFFDQQLVNHITQVFNKSNDIEILYDISTDTRSYEQGQAFIAIKGEKYDAFQFLAPLLSKIPLVVFESSPENMNLVKTWAKEYEKTCFIAVKNSVSYLQLLASVHVKHWHAQTSVHHLIAISGSNGKTTTKEMLYHLLKNVLKNDVIATKKNNNNHIGVPLTLLDIHPYKTKAAVVEFGSNHPGEMNVLCNLAHPNVGITTNIGHTHMEFFNELTDVFKEEGLIYHAIMKETSQKGLFLINDDDEFLKTFQDTPGSKRFSTSHKNTHLHYELGHDFANITFQNFERYTVKNIYITGNHNFLNLANAFVIATTLFPEHTNEFLQAATTFQPTSNRSEWITFAEREIFLDAYNANPSSMKAALLGFLDLAKSQNISFSGVLVVVGEMKELGTRAPQYHGEFAHWLKNLNLPHIFYIGDFRSEIQKECPHIRCFSKVEDAKDEFLQMLKNSKKCFIKASRSLQLERLVGITKG